MNLENASVLFLVALLIPIKAITKAHMADSYTNIYNEFE
jgi:hypothetical protein